MRPRRITHRLRNQLSRFPAVVLVGPRQVGKTTLARSLPGRYFDLESPQDRLRLNVEWEQLVAGRELVIIDEAHVVPELFALIRSAIDQARTRRGRFLLLGSVSPALMTQVSQSLAGRLAICELSPFLVQEVAAGDADRLWRVGGYPDGGILQPSRYPEWQQYYLQLMAQRDLPAWGLPARPTTTARLFDMLAALHGHAWNASQIGKSLGLSYHTVNAYVEILEHAFLIRRLPAYAANLKKRLVKSPKLYWRDTGLLHALLHLDPAADILTRPWAGVSWEGFVIEQLLGELQTAGKPHRAYYLRTSDQQEIDLILEYRNLLWALEVKLSSVVSDADVARLKSLGRTIRADRFVLISRSKLRVEGRTELALNPRATIEMLLAT